MKIAVIGAGIFGVSISFTLAHDHTIDLYERNSDILMAASDINQCRVHRGYHYPRSNETVLELLDANTNFTNEFNDAIMSNTTIYYAIAKNDSLTTSTEYIEFCKRNNLEYDICQPSFLNNDLIDLCIKVDEHLFDHDKLKQICWNKLKSSNVNVLLNTEATQTIFDDYDLVIICTYGDWKHLVKDQTKLKQNFQFEVCEKVFVTLPENFTNTSLLIMDGPFMSIDPVGDTGMFIIGDVVHTVRQRSIGKSPVIDEKYLPFLNKGILTNCPVSNYQLFLDSAARFMPELENAKYVGSSFCIKTTLANVDSTDTRPTIIDQIDSKTITVFSGKIPTCIETALKIKELVFKIEQNN